MPIEELFFILRALAALSLLAFLLALFFIIWRNTKQIEAQLRAAGQARGFLLRSDNQAAGAALERFALLPITTLGRSANNSIVVDDEFASSRHAQILLENGQWWLEDRRSRNGTRLNDETIARRTILADGDVIGIGTYRFRLELNPSSISNGKREA